MSCSTRSGQIPPLLAHRTQRPALDSAPVGGPCHGSTREQSAGEVGGLRPRAPGLLGVYSEEAAVSDLHEEAWAGGTSVTRCVLPLLSTQEKPSCHREQVGHSRVPWAGLWTQPWGHSLVEVTSR